MIFDYNAADIKRVAETKSDKYSFATPPRSEQHEAVSKYFGMWLLVLNLDAGPIAVFSFGLEMGMLLRQQQIDAEQTPNTPAQLDPIEQELAEIFAKEKNIK